jgi:hypothetical protein
MFTFLLGSPWWSLVPVGIFLTLMFVVQPMWERNYGKFHPSTIWIGAAMAITVLLGQIDFVIAANLILAMIPGDCSHFAPRGC